MPAPHVHNVLTQPLQVLMRLHTHGCATASIELPVGRTVMRVIFSSPDCYSLSVYSQKVK